MSFARPAPKRCASADSSRSAALVAGRRAACLREKRGRPSRVRLRARRESEPRGQPSGCSAERRKSSSPTRALALAPTSDVRRPTLDVGGNAGFGLCDRRAAVARTSNDRLRAPPSFHRFEGIGRSSDPRETVSKARRGRAHRHFTAFEAPCTRPGPRETVFRAGCSRAHACSTVCRSCQPVGDR